MDKPISNDDRDKIVYSLLPQAFNPAGPISRKDMFKGRSQQISDSLNAVFQPYQHLVIVGERGVGKSSLANIIYDLITSLGKKVPSYWYGKVNCGKRETFTSLWKEAFRNVKFTQKIAPVGFTQGLATGNETTYTLTDVLTEREFTPSRIVSIIRDNPGVWVFDEFNTLPRREAQPFADLIKALSDAGAKAKIALVGVADSLAALIEDHGSIDRSVRQILMPRMAPAELEEILTGAESITGLNFHGASKNEIIGLSQGLPYFTHQVGLCSAKAAVSQLKTSIAPEDISAGIDEALRASEESIREAYRLAIHSRKPSALYAHVLLACALASKDPFGFFKQTDVSETLSSIRKRRTVPGVFAAHLAGFISQDRGSILSRRGSPQNYVYRFSNPLLQPYTIMMGIKSGMIPPDWLNNLR
ncbi:MAG: hypothetical protein C4519_13880 [Desulfobacteraceae bacterium]|nr:MAG: hypothetical protein C4519_13880 [Desulfobacteraceae bacterium]